MTDPAGAPATPFPYSRTIRTRHDQYIPAPVATYYQEALVPVAGKGSWITDLDGKTYLDFFGGILTVSLGHAHRRVTRAAVAQMLRLSHTSTFYPNLPMVELAERLVAAAPGRLDQVFFTSSGSEADEMAVLLAQAHTGNQEVIALRHGYAGRTLLAQALDGLSSHRAAPSALGAVKHAPAPYCYRCPLRLDPDTCGTACARDLEELIATTTTGRVAGMLIEPVLGAGGCIPLPEKYPEIAAETIRRHGGVMIVDEVQTGIGRTGRMWGVQQAALEPDLMTVGKGIANGLPLAATLCTREIAGSFRARSISTFSGNPVACAAANAVLEEMTERDLVANAQAQGERLREGLKAIQGRFPEMIGDVRGLGLMQGLELVRDETIRDRTPAPDAADALLEATREHGLLVGRGGLFANIIRIAPPLNVSRDEIEAGLRLLADAFESVHGSGHG